MTEVRILVRTNNFEEKCLIYHYDAHFFSGIVDSGGLYCLKERRRVQVWTQTGGAAVTWYAPAYNYIIRSQSLLYNTF